MDRTEHASLRESLEHTIAARRLVRIHRSPRHADRVDGIPVASGARWLLVARTGDGGYLDEGFEAIRLKQIERIDDDTSFEGRFARTLAEWPPAAPDGVDLDTTAGLIESLGTLAPLLGVEQEGRLDGARWIGAPRQVGDGWLWLREIRPDATWHDDPLGYRLRRITKVAVLNRYQRARATIAAPD